MVLPWGAIIQGVSSAVKSVGKGATKTAKSGARMASNITRRRSAPSDTVSQTQSRTEGISPIKFLKVKPIKADKMKSSGDGSPVFEALDGIDNTIFNIINGVADSSKLKIKETQRKNRRIGVQKKQAREEKLEKKGGWKKKMGRGLPGPIKSVFDSIMGFVTNIIVGGLVLSIFKWLPRLIEVLKGVRDQIVEFWKGIEPIAVSIWDFGKWMAKQSILWSAKLLGVEDADTRPALENLSEIVKKIPEIFGVFGGLVKFVSGLQGKKDTSPGGNLMPSVHHDAPSPAAVEASKNLIRQRESFSEKPYWDVNAWRAGYGSDTYTKEDGTVHKVTESTMVSKEDAERDLERRVVEEFMMRAMKQVGPARFNSLPIPAQAALVSIAYNYGSLPERILPAAISGDLNKLASAVESLKTDDGGINAERRQGEANMIRGGLKKSSSNQSLSRTSNSISEFATYENSGNNTTLFAPPPPPPVFGDNRDNVSMIIPSVPSAASLLNTYYRAQTLRELYKVG